MYNLPIIKNEPEDWIDLQRVVSMVLNGCGFDTAIEKSIVTVRGTVKIDVFAEKAGAFKTVILCECKYWNSIIPQTIVHAFRTIVEDSGSNQGIVIAKEGFQKGAYNAIEKSNILLYTWEEFQNAFKMEYLQFVINRNYKKGHELRTKTNAIIDISCKNSLALTEEEFNEFQSLREVYSDFLFYSFKEHYEHLDTKEITLAEVERGMIAGARDLDINPRSLIEYFDYIYNQCDQFGAMHDTTLLLVQKRINETL